MSEQTSSDPPVTVVAAHRVKPGKEKAFEETMSGMIQAAMTFEDHLEANVLRPTSPSPSIEPTQNGQAVKINHSLCSTDIPIHGLPILSGFFVPPLQYRIIFKVDRMSNLHRWETSQIRHEWLIRLAELTGCGQR